jgi:hypothetical protein
METYPIGDNNKQKENLVIKHILHTNKYNQIPINRRNQKQHNCEEPTKTQKWAKFNYIGKETRTVTKIFQKAGIKIAYTTAHTIRYLLSQHPRRSNQYESKGAYQLTCRDCGKLYIGQTDRSFQTRFKEHTRDYQMNYQNSLYAKHLIQNQHTLHSIENCLTILHHQKA